MARITMILLNIIFIFNFFWSFSESSQQLCVNPCQFQIVTEDIGKWPTDQCQSQEKYAVCKIVISITHLLRTASISFQPYNDSTDPSDKIPNDVQGILSARSQYTFWIPRVEPTFYVTYRCRTNDDMCDKKFITENWSKIITSFKADSDYQTLSTLLYQPQSTAGRCFFDEQQQVQDCRGFCQYSYYDYQFGPTYGCMTTAGPTSPVDVTFESNRVQVGPNDADQDTLSILCNKENCNDPSSVDQVKKLFNFKEPAKSSASTHHSLLFFVFLSIFSMIN